ncbi:probable 2-oxoglutarate-dependent dioxygenase AOP1 [Pyrus x bretschneideri]|uniref:probable 2-oxoglutarate-dependent dioxygenase AOP1 n=1 Tax=Pyrus x bretschneideri TaxID=225117 RepID=UPI00203098B6|nr:probable 2-oxoglutarate-dependent dioxygenase AOP1 [Pyrus x bretschneideri]
MASRTQTAAKIPVVDFSQEDCWKSGTSSWLSVRRDVCNALEEFGCFLAVLPNKVSRELNDTMFGTFNELFDFPDEIKAQFPQDKPLVEGYVRLPTRESMSFRSSTEKIKNVTCQLWPEGNDQFRESADLYSKVMTELNQVVTKMVFENYKVEKYHDDHIQSTMPTTLLIKYDEPKTDETETVLHIHTDKCFTTVLHQESYGVEISTKDNEWIGYDPLPSSLLFLAGDGLQVWSNDRIKSCKHKVVLKENKVRYSFGQFFWNKGVIYVPNELTDEDHPMQYKAIDLVEYLQYYYENMSTVGFDFSVKDYCGKHNATSMSLKGGVGK